MNDLQPVRVLRLEDSPISVNRVKLFWEKHEPGRFVVTWNETSAGDLLELGCHACFNVFLLHDSLPGQNGIEVTCMVQNLFYTIPIIILTVDRDFAYAIEVTKLGVEEYFLKDEFAQSEISQQQLDTDYQLIEQITGDLWAPLDDMRHAVEQVLASHQQDDIAKRCLPASCMLPDRIEQRLAYPRELKTDKTIPYSQDTRMLNLSASPKALTVSHPSSS